MISIQFLNYPSAVHALVVCLPLAGAILNGFLFSSNPVRGAQIATAIVWVTWVMAISGLINALLYPNQENSVIFSSDTLSWLMAVLISGVSGIVHHFSLRYMAGDRIYHRYFITLSLITSTALLMVSSDHLLGLLAGWGLSNVLLVRLMVHKSDWAAAYQSGRLAFRTFAFGFLCLLVGTGLLAKLTNSFSMHTIQTLDGVSLPTLPLTMALGLILVAAMTQSAQVPFHRWLISSLNSPTPVSALMHAGLVNGGGFLLVRFAPLYLAQPGLLTILFTIGSFTAVIGTVWKLIQSDLKRMLACSTMGQMGFMMMQCGLGLFPAAVAHLCWHGLFKAYLFLSGGSAAQEKRNPMPRQLGSPLALLLALPGGLAGAYAFATLSEKPFLAANTTALLIGFAFMSTIQIAYTVLQTGKMAWRWLPATVLALLAGGLYGLSVHAIETLLTPLAISVPQPLHGLHLLFFGVFLVAWLALNLKGPVRQQTTRLWHYFYVKALNTSQPHPDTTTPTRNAYQY